MEPIDSLDKNTASIHALTAQEVLRRLAQHGFPQSYELENGDIEIQGVSALKCKMIQYSDGSWGPDVSVEWLSAYVLIPSVGCSLFSQALGFNGLLVISALFGLGIGSLLLNERKNKVSIQLENVIESDSQTGS